jgi:GAF domain-containing protein
LPDDVRLEGLLTDLCEELVRELAGVGCIVSRVIGDVLVQIAEYAPDGRSFALGRGFLVSEFPETQAVLESGRPRAVSTTDEAPDPGELMVLQELELESVLMLALQSRDTPWGLVEVYRNEPATFSTRELKRAQATVRRAQVALPLT